jgi:hypothetical protein
MIDVVDPLPPVRKGESLPIQSLPAVQTVVSDVYTQTQKTNAIRPGPQRPDYPWLNPGEVLSGMVWCFFLAFSARRTRDSVDKLKKMLLVKNPTPLQSKETRTAVKEVFDNFLSSVGNVGFVMAWAHKVKLLPLGKYAPWAKSMWPGSMLISSSVDAGAQIYNIYTHGKAAKYVPEKREEHKQHIYAGLIDLIARVGMIAWAVLTIAAVSAGTPESSFLLNSLFFTSMAGMFAAHSYEPVINESTMPTV